MTGISSQSRGGVGGETAKPNLRLQKEGVWGDLILTLVAGMTTNLRSGGDRSPGLDGWRAQYRFLKLSNSSRTMNAMLVSGV